MLPFEQLGNFDGVFADGMTEHTIASLCRDGNDISVIAPTSVMRYKHTSKTTQQICHDLRCDYLLEGTAWCSDGVIRIDAALIERWEQSCVWADSFTRRGADVLGIQDEIAREISGFVLRAVATARATTAEPSK